MDGTLTGLLIHRFVSQVFEAYQGNNPCLYLSEFWVLLLDLEVSMSIQSHCPIFFKLDGKVHASQLVISSDDYRYASKYLSSELHHLFRYRSRAQIIELTCYQIARLNPNRHAY